MPIVKRIAAGNPAKPATKAPVKRYGASKKVARASRSEAGFTIVVGSDNAVAEVISGKPALRDYRKVWRATARDKIRVIEAGVPSQFLTVMAKDMQVPQSILFGWAGIAPATAKRKLKERKPLSSDEGERALGIAQLVGQVEDLIKASGNTEAFNAKTWLARWLNEPNPALGGEPPARYMHTGDGRGIVSDLIAMGAGGGFA